MSMNLTDAIRRSLSPERLAAYEAAANGNEQDALHLYLWNAQACAALLAPLHFCEVIIRNAAAEAIEAVHGSQWPWNAGFERSLPRVAGTGYCARTDLQHARRTAHSASHVIAGLKFVFWEKLFTSRHDGKLWNSQLHHVMPNLNPGRSVACRRTQIFKHLGCVRKLRNRIAHHEPIHARNLSDDYAKIQHLIRARCEISAQWMLTERIHQVLADRPVRRAI